MAGRVIGGRYQLGRRLGAGGMAEVYLGVDRRLGREVAVKVLGPAYVADAVLVERFKREARAAAGLTHAHIVAVFDWGTDDDLYYMVMEYVAGPTLKEVLRQRGPLPEDEVLRIGAQIAAALAAAHERGVVHRDVKPHNVLLNAAGQVKVTDFGIAHIGGVAQLTETHTVVGTAQYLSPEQAQHQPVDGRSDLYSLGAVLYELLTGEVPFAGESPLAVAWQHVHTPPPPPRARRADLSPLTEAVVLTALAKDPAARYDSAATMGRALEQARARLAGAAAPTARLRLDEADATTRLIAEQAVTPGGEAGATAPPGATAPTLPIVPVARVEPPTAAPPDGPPPDGPPRPAVPTARRDVTPDRPPAPPAGGQQTKDAQPDGPRRETAGAAGRHAPRRRGWRLVPLAAAIAVPLLALPVAYQALDGPRLFRADSGETAPPPSPATPATQPPVAPTVPPAPSPTAPPAPSPTVPPAPTATAPPAPSPTAPPAPTATSAPQPTATAAPPSPTPAPQTPPQEQGGGAPDPQQAVRGFYQLVAQGHFDGAATMWTQRMQARHPPDEYINRRFSGTRRLDLQEARVVELDERAGRAVVAITLVEISDSAPRGQRITGTWHLVRGPSGWLLDQPALQLVNI